MKALPICTSVLLIPLIAVMPLQADWTEGPGNASPNPEISVPNSPTPAESGGLQILVSESGSAAVEINSIVPGYSITVTNASGIPVAGAAVAVRLPEDAPTGYFVDGVHSAVAYTDVSGIAKFGQIHWNATKGVASVMITAVKGDLRAGTVIEQTLVAHSGAASPPVSLNTGTPANPGTPTKPGTATAVADIYSGASGDPSPVHTAETSAAADSSVSVVNSSSATGASHGGRKWILLALVAAGAGIGAAMALGMAGKGAATTVAPSSGLSIGSPTISVGH